MERDNNKPTTMAEAAERYIVAHPTVRSPKTMHDYRQTAERFEAFLKRAPTVDDFKDETVGRYWRWRGEQVAVNTLNTEACNLLALWRWAALNGWVRAPLIVAPPRVYKSPRALTVEQLVALFDAAEKTEAMIGTTVANRF